MNFEKTIFGALEIGDYFCDSTKLATYEEIEKTIKEGAADLPGLVFEKCKGRISWFSEEETIYAHCDYAGVTGEVLNEAVVYKVNMDEFNNYMSGYYEYHNNIIKARQEEEAKKLIYDAYIPNDEDYNHESLTVSKLIEVLQSVQDKNKIVEINVSYDCGYGHAGGDILYIKDTGDTIRLINDEG